MILFGVCKTFKVKSFDLAGLLRENSAQMMRRFLGVILGVALLAAGLQACTHTSSTEVFDFDREIAKKECIAIFPFDNVTDYPNAGRVVADLMATSLFRSGKFRLMERSEIERVAQLSHVALPRRTQANFVRSLGEILEVDAVLIGSVTEFAYLDPAVGNPGVNISATLVDVASGKTLWVGSHARTSTDEIQYKKDPLLRVAALAVEAMTQPFISKVPARTVNHSAICGNSEAIIPPPSEELEQVALPTSGVLLGRTTSPKLNSAVGSVILEFPNRDISRLLSDNDTGSFKLDNLSPGTIRVIASKDGFSDSIIDAEIVPGKTTIVNVPMNEGVSTVTARKKSGGAVAGRIVDLQGQPVNATVFLQTSGREAIRASTDEKGKFVLKQITPGSYQVRIVAKSYITQSKVVKVDNNAKVILDVNLHKARGD